MFFFSFFTFPDKVRFLSFPEAKDRKTISENGLWSFKIGSVSWDPPVENRWSGGQDGKVLNDIG